ncbi:MAG: hypothetical protein QM811_07430 [Pirellulales bacterium]
MLQAIGIGSDSAFLGTNIQAFLVLGGDCVVEVGGLDVVRRRVAVLHVKFLADPDEGDVRDELAAILVDLDRFFGRGRDLDLRGLAKEHDDVRQSAVRSRDDGLIRNLDRLADRVRTGPLGDERRRVGETVKPYASAFRCNISPRREIRFLSRGFFTP